MLVNGHSGFIIIVCDQLNYVQCDVDHHGHLDEDGTNTPNKSIVGIPFLIEVERNLVAEEVLAFHQFIHIVQ